MKTAGVAPITKTLQNQEPSNQPPGPIRRIMHGAIRQLTGLSFVYPSHADLYRRGMMRYENATKREYKGDSFIHTARCRRQES